MREIFMKCDKSNTFYFAIREATGKAVNISELEEKDRGKKCGCVCAACGRHLVAKLGRGSRRPHFSHLPLEEGEVSCSAEWANESGLHKMAKEIIQNESAIMLPAIKVSSEQDPNYNPRDMRQWESLEYRPERLFKYQKAALEVSQKDFVPDIIVSGEKASLAIEIAVTHFVDEEKEQKIRAAQMPTIEIDISEFFNSEDFSRERLSEQLLRSVEHKKWVYNRLENKALRAVCERNKKLEEEYQRKQKEEQNRQERINKWIEEQKRHESQVESEEHNLETDRQYWIRTSRALIWPDERVLDGVNSLGICKLKFESIDKLPVFLNIPVFGEVAFNCDRRIWQTILFENFIFRRQPNSTLCPERIYTYFAGHKADLLSKKYVHIRKKTGGSIHFPFLEDRDVLRRAIEEYLVHLSALGFVNEEYYRNPEPEEEYSISRYTLEPPQKEYERFLKRVLPYMPLTDKPFDYLQRQWIDSCEKHLDAGH